MHADQVYGVSSDTLVQLASGLDGHCVKKQYSLVGLCFGGRMALDLHLIAAMRQDCNYYQLDTMKLGCVKKYAKIEKIRKGANIFPRHCTQGWQVT